MQRVRVLCYNVVRKKKDKLFLGLCVESSPYMSRSTKIIKATKQSIDINLYIYAQGIETIKENLEHLDSHTRHIH